MQSRSLKVCVFEEIPEILNKQPEPRLTQGESCDKHDKKLDRCNLMKHCVYFIIFGFRYELTDEQFIDFDVLQQGMSRLCCEVETQRSLTLSG
jgi:hypothetical protein